MSPDLPLSPSFVSLSTATTSSAADDVPPTPKVRFDQECVLIPDPLPMSRMPRLVTKSYSLPLWKRKRSPSVVSESEDEPLEDHVVFKVSVPSIVTKTRSPSRDAASRPLVSCLVHSGDPSSSGTPASPPRPMGRPRRGSLPVAVHPDAVTIPLRSCCAQCYPSIDKCMKEGDHWEIRFSRGALRRRKSLSDAHTPSRTRHCVRDAMPGFDAIVAVDEVDQRRKSTDMDALTAFTIQVPTTSASASSEVEEIPLRRALSLPDAVHPSRARLLPDLHPHALSPPILEEDELRPSPRRTPIPSPRGSSTNLPSTRVIHAVHMVTAEKVPPVPAKPSPSPSPEESLLNLSLDHTFSSSPITLTPSVPIPDREAPSPYYAGPYSRNGHGRGISLDSPTSSPTSSPRMAHARSTSTLESPGSRKKPLLALPGTIFRASTSVLKGISGMSGIPMSA
ncbi:hypothetical protein C8Q76DRAFT_612087 [Earliella scabrosa]|nr:hypothetical protein C8Q76DRAFT_612087 [Earliella scabrosa]